MTTKPIETVLAWHAALNEADVERLLSLSTADIEVGGPRGSGHGADLLRDWVNRAAVRLEPRRIFCRAGAEVVVVEQEARTAAHLEPRRIPCRAEAKVVVVEQSARWPSANGHLADPQIVASVFRVADGLVASVIRHPDLPSALAAADLNIFDEYVAAPSPS